MTELVYIVFRICFCILQDKIILLGHSSGAHLCALTMLELFHDEILPSNETGNQSPSSLQFRERHFTGNSDNDDKQSSGSSESFQVLNGQNSNGFQTNDSSKTSLSASQFVVLETQKSETEMSEGSLLESEIKELTQSEISGVRYRGISQDVSLEGASGGKTGEINAGESDDSDSVITLKGEEEELLPTLTVTQPPLIELRKSVKAVVGEILTRYNQSCLLSG